MYRASSGFWAVWKIAWSTAAASTISAEAPKPSPCDAAMTAVPDSATALPGKALAHSSTVPAAARFADPFIAPSLVPCLLNV